MASPCFTVIKDGCFLNNIVLLNRQQDVKEKTLFMGRHQSCHIVATNPSVSRYHLRIYWLPCSRRIFLTDLNSANGTWVRGEKIEPNVSVELSEGDTFRVGLSTRVYKLQWVYPSSESNVENPLIVFCGKAVEEENDVVMDEDEMIVESEIMVANVNDSLQQVAGNRDETSQVVDAKLDDEKQSQFLDSICEVEEKQIVSSLLVLEDTKNPSLSPIHFCCKALDEEDDVVMDEDDEMIVESENKITKANDSLQHGPGNKDKTSQEESFENEEKTSMSRDYNGPTESGGLFFASLATKVSEQTRCGSSLSESTSDISNFSSLTETDQVKEDDQTQQLVDLPLAYHEGNLKIYRASSSLSMLTRENTEKELFTLHKENYTPTTFYINWLAVSSLSSSSESERLVSVSPYEDPSTKSATSEDTDSNGAKVPWKDQKQVERIYGSVSKALFSNPRAPEENLFTPNKENYTSNTFYVNWLAEPSLFASSESRRSVSASPDEDSSEKSPTSEDTNSSEAKVSWKDQKQFKRIKRSFSKALFSSPRAHEEPFTPNKENYTPNTFYINWLAEPSPPASSESERLVSVSSPSGSDSESKSLSTGSLTSQSVLLTSESFSNMVSQFNSEQEINTSSIWSERGKPVNILDLKTSSSGRETRETQQCDVEAPWKDQELTELINKSVSKNLFSSPRAPEQELLNPNKENYNPNTWQRSNLHRPSAAKKNSWPPIRLDFDINSASDDENQSPGLVFLLKERESAMSTSATPLSLEQRMVFNERTERVPSESLSMESAGETVSVQKGIICKTTQEMVNPFSESSPRGLAWLLSDNTVMKAKFDPCPSKMYAEGGRKGLKLIMQQDSYNGIMRPPFNAPSRKLYSGHSKKFADEEEAKGLQLILQQDGIEFSASSKLFSKREGANLISQQDSDHGEIRQPVTAFSILKNIFLRASLWSYR